VTDRHCFEVENADDGTILLRVMLTGGGITEFFFTHRQARTLYDDIGAALVGGAKSATLVGG